ncbi:MAG TPA: DEAD/DEAH box helicase [Candidatus Acidoferrales bacterium]|nr:DEAD/DEAH box helicase [Candidatus Acidoferrales bacterium]
MDVASLKGKIPNELLESMLARGIVSFTPPQEGALNSGLMQGKNILVASPTASGKTLIAEMAAINSIIGKGRKAIYIAPMRALASEKYEEFKAAYPYIKAAISIGDLDSNDLWLANYEMLFFSTEKFDSLVRHGLEWLPSIGCIVFDEVHMLGDSSRGPTLELLITKLASLSSAQILALSATVGNADELGKWLNAEIVKSEFRPVVLQKGVVHESNLYYSEAGDRKLVSTELLGTSRLPETRIIEDTLEQKKQALVFYSSKRNTESGALRLSRHTYSHLTAKESAELKELAGRVLNSLPNPTEQCSKLSSLIEKGIAFHHAGLMNQQRHMIEDAFRAGIIKAICSTTTLGLGVNMPAHTVIVKDITRFNDTHSERIGVNEVMQLFGRAGRPKYDKEGRALLIASTKERVKDLYEHYMLAKPEPIESSLGIAPVLRTHILAFIAENFLNDKASMEKFLAKTFYSFQYGNQRHISNVIKEVLSELKEWEFVEEIDRDLYKATRLGKRVSELYIDPLSARMMLNAIDGEMDIMDVLFMISNTLEMRPHAKQTEEAEAQYIIHIHSRKQKKVLTDPYSMDYGFYDPVRAFSTALLLKDWMEETKEPAIVEKYSSTPGFLFNKITNADWLIYSAIELAKIMHKSVHKMIEARVRMRYGIKEELLDLVRLEQIGRARARTLYTNGITSVKEIRDNREKVARLLGKEISEKVFAQLE